MPFIIFVASFNFLGINNLSSYKFIIMRKFFFSSFWWFHGVNLNSKKQVNSKKDFDIFIYIYI